jgi:hypothetical protein
MGLLHPERRDGIYAALWREQERAKGWRLGQAAAGAPASRA